MCYLWLYLISDNRIRSYGTMSGATWQTESIIDTLLIPTDSILVNTTDFYRYGFQGQEKDNEMYNNEGTSYTTYFRQNDVRLGRWFATDPKPNASVSPYAMMENNPIWFSDAMGDTIFKSTVTGSKNIAIIHVSTDDKNKYQLHEKWKGQMAGWDYIVTDDLSDVPGWLEKNYKGKEIKNLAIRQHSYTTVPATREGFDIYHTDAEGNVQILIEDEIISQSGDDASEDNLINTYKQIFSFTETGSTIIMAPCRIASEVSLETLEASVNTDIAQGIFAMIGDPLATLYLNYNASTMYSAFNTGKGTFTDLSKINEVDGKGWVKIDLKGVKATGMDLRPTIFGISATPLPGKQHAILQQKGSNIGTPSFEAVCLVKNEF